MNAIPTNGMTIVFREPWEVKACLYALGSLADNEHDKGCDEAFCNWEIDTLIEKLEVISKKSFWPYAAELTFTHAFVLYSAADIFHPDADEISELPGAEDFLRGLSINIELTTKS